MAAIVAAIALVSALLSGCGGGDTESGGVTRAGAPQLLATTSIWADITSHVACGEEVTALIPNAADPHTFEPSLRDRATVERAALVIANGNDLEGSLVDLLDTAISEGVDVIEMTSHVDLLGGSGADGDPHVWQDPTRVAGALDVIASAVVAAGRDREAIEACTTAYHDELIALDGEIDELLSIVPPPRRVMVTSHDSLAYFGDRYTIEIVGTVIPSTNTLAETNAADLAELAEIISERGVPAVFTERLESAADAERLAERLGVRIVPLVTDALTDDPATDTYVEMLRSNATAIAEALVP